MSKANAGAGAKAENGKMKLNQRGNYIRSELKESKKWVWKRAGWLGEKGVCNKRGRILGEDLAKQLKIHVNAIKEKFSYKQSHVKLYGECAKYWHKQKGIRGYQKRITDIRTLTACQ